MAFFVSWSGDNSRLLAEQISCMLKNEFKMNDNEVYFSPEHQGRGSIWNDAQKITLYDNAIFVLDSDNVKTPCITAEFAFFSSIFHEDYYLGTKYYEIPSINKALSQAFFISVGGQRIDKNILRDSIFRNANIAKFNKVGVKALLNYICTQHRNRAFCESVMNKKTEKFWNEYFLNIYEKIDDNEKNSITNGFDNNGTVSSSESSHEWDYNNLQEILLRLVNNNGKEVYNNTRRLTGYLYDERISAGLVNSLKTIFDCGALKEILVLNDSPEKYRINQIVEDAYKKTLLTNARELITTVLYSLGFEQSL